MDFTISIYKNLLQSLIVKKYTFITFKDLIHLRNNFNNNNYVILKHDIDHLPKNSLITAIIENSMGIKGSYYFRIIPKIYDKIIIQKIAALGHEIGYHYEDMDLARKKIQTRNNNLVVDNIIPLAYESFCKNLDLMRKIYPVVTICAHGSPLSPYDNTRIWDNYDYKKLNIIGDPSFDIDWNEFVYFTDTGRRWNGAKVSVRDKVSHEYDFNFRTTRMIINNIDKLPKKIVFTIHTHRWHDPGIMWLQELIFQNLKNVAKYFIVRQGKYDYKVQILYNSQR